MKRVLIRIQYFTHFSMPDPRWWILKIGDSTAQSTIAKKVESYAEAQQRKKERRALEIAASMVGQKNNVSDDDNQCDFTKIEIRVGKIQKVS
jgi:hypothetical protein